MFTRGLMSASAALLLVVASAVAPVHASAAGRDVVIGPGDDVKAAMESLRPGDQLRLQPGVYDVGGIHPTLTSGTADQRILVTAVDGSDLPLLRGFVVLNNANYWTFQYLRFQATLLERSALEMAGGIGWSVRKSEFFGAAATKSFANVAISSSDGNVAPPQHWNFSDNCVHDAGPGVTTVDEPGRIHSAYTDHNIYVNIARSPDIDGSQKPPSPGLIARNLLFNATHGANIKIGVGGDGQTPGADGVHVEYNTMYNAGRQVVLLGNIKNEYLHRNLLVRSIAPIHGGGQVLVGVTNQPSMTSANNFAYLMQSGRNIDPYNSAAATYKDLGDNVAHPSGEDDPLLTGSGCSGYLAKNAAVAGKYGRQAAGAGTVPIP